MIRPELMNNSIVHFRFEISGNNTRIFSTQNLEIVEIVADGGVNYAIGSRVVPVVVKGALATGRA